MNRKVYCSVMIPQ